MRQLPRLARIYLISCYMVGLAAVLWLVFSSPRQTPTVLEWLLAAGLSIIAAGCQVFVVNRANTSGARGDNLTPAPLFAALMLVPRPLLAMVLVFTFVPDWIIHRRKWFPQLFNISSYLIASSVARLSLFYLTGHYRLDNPAELASIKVLLLIPLFLGTQTLLLAWGLKLAMGQPVRASGLFAPTKLFVEIGLVCVGLLFATSWSIHPLYGILAALPLALVFQALHVPNLKEEAATDPKTGLANMRHFNFVFARELDRAQRNATPISVLMCDLDYLRNINNTYGHQAGDAVLLGIANIIRRAIRSNDVGARFGGEEFVVLLTDTDADGALVVAERIRNELEQSGFETGKPIAPIKATISIGIASLPTHGRTAEELLHEADLAVYQAKREGRNRVVVAGRASRGLAGEWAREHLVAVPAQTSSYADAGQTPFWDFINRMGNTTSPTVVEPAKMISPAPPAPHAKETDQRAGWRRTDIPLTVLSFITIVFVAGLVNLFPGILVQDVPWLPLALFAGLTIGAEMMAVKVSQRMLTSVVVVVVLTAAFLFHELGILVTVFALSVSAAIKVRSRPHRLLFNFGALLLSAEGAHWLFRALVAREFSSEHIAHMILPATCAGLAYYGINHMLLCCVRGLSEKRSPIQIWNSDYRWLAPHYAAFGALALVNALGYLALGPIGVTALMAPVAMMHVAIKQYTDRTTTHVEELRRMNSRLTDSYEATLQALSRALDTRDEETEEHSQRVRRYTQIIAQRLGVAPDELEDIARGALLHDIGKIGVPDAILLKPGKLTPEEVMLMRKHPEIGYSMIAHIPFLTKAAHVVLHHHEAYDGSGYPSGLAGANIPLGARIFALADTFDAMTSDRPYRKGLPPSTAIAEIERCRGTQFDPHIVDVFLSIPLDELMGASPPMTRHMSLTVPEVRSLEQLALQQI